MNDPFCLGSEMRLQCHPGVERLLVSEQACKAKHSESDTRTTKQIASREIKWL
jgi:hypothetical protein